MKGFGCRPIWNLAAAPTGQRAKAAGKERAGSRAPETAQGYEDFESAAGVRMEEVWLILA